MRGIKGWGLGFRLNTILFLLFIFLYPIPYTLYPVSAAESTPSADIKAKLEELKKDIASKAAKLKQEVSNKLKNKAYIGKVKTKSQTSITLATKNGPKIVNINQDTEFVSNIKNKKYTQNLISEEDYLSALGDVDETGVLTAKRIILLPTPSSLEKTFLWGQIISISDTLVTLKTSTGKNFAVSLPNSKVKNLEFVILTGYKNKNEIFEADYVYVIPQGGILKPKKTATPSATIKPTKTASPSATPKPSLKPTSR